MDIIWWNVMVELGNTCYKDARATSVNLLASGRISHIALAVSCVMFCSSSVMIWMSSKKMITWSIKRVVRATQMLIVLTSVTFYLNHLRTSRTYVSNTGGIMPNRCT